MDENATDLSKSGKDTKILSLKSCWLSFTLIVFIALSLHVHDRDCYPQSGTARAARAVLEKQSERGCGQQWLAEFPFSVCTG